MPTFNSPALHTTVSRTLYESQINENFQKIQSALDALQNIIPSVSGAGLQPSNLLWVDKSIAPDGVLGTQAFTPSFDDNTDGVTSVTITHPDQAESTATVQSVFHRMTSEASFSLTGFIPAADGSMTIAIGLKSLGAPAVEVVVEELITDATYDLLVWTFDLIKISNTLYATNLRRQADVLMNRESWLKQWTLGSVININVEGQLSSAVGNISFGFVAPYNLKVMEAQFHLGQPPAAGQTVEVQLVNEDDATDAGILDGTATWAPGVSGTVEISGMSPETIVSKGSKVYLEILQADATTDEPDAAGDLTVTVLVERVYHEVR
jgi:hypothetical protein